MLFRAIGKFVRNFRTTRNVCTLTVSVNSGGHETRVPITKPHTCMNHTFFSQQRSNFFFNSISYVILRYSIGIVTCPQRLIAASYDTVRPVVYNSFILSMENLRVPF